MVTDTLRGSKIYGEGRTDDNELICPVEGCKTIIHGWTGLDELQNLRKHMARKHRRNVDTGDALTIRHNSEHGVPTTEGLTV